MAPWEKFDGQSSLSCSDDIIEEGEHWRRRADRPVNGLFVKAHIACWARRRQCERIASSPPGNVLANPIMSSLTQGIPSSFVSRE